MSEFTQAFFKEISPETLEEVCQVAEAIAREEEDDDSPPLSPIVGYTISDNSTVSSSSDTDPESRNVLNQLNSLIFHKTDVDTPKTKARRGKQRRKRRKIMSREETEFADKPSGSHGSFEKTRTRLNYSEELNFTEIQFQDQAQQNVNQTNYGFSTASGKEISVSHDAVKEAQTRMKEIESLNSTELMNFNKGQQSVNTSMGGFSTAGGKYISVSHDSVKQAQTRLKEIVNLNSTELMNFKTKSGQSCTPSMGGFSTAGGKDIAVSRVAVEQAQTRMKEIESLKSTELMNFNKGQQSVNTSMGGFSTAGGKYISVSHDSVKQAQTRLKEIVNLNSTELMNFKKTTDQNFNLSMGGFSTAGGKDIAVSRVAVEKAQTRMKEIESLNSTELMDFNKGQQSVTTSMGDFPTAGVKCIPLSDDDFNHPQTKWKEIVNLNSNQLMDLNNAQNNVNLSMGGFSTAGGKYISVSHDSVKQAQTRLKEIVNLNSTELMDFKNKTGQNCNPSMGGFSTARGKDIVVSRDAVEQAQTRMKEIEELKSSELLNFKNKTERKVNPIKVKISKAGGIDDYVSSDDLEENERRLNFSFTSGKGVSVSYDALKKADSFLIDIDQLSPQGLSNLNTKQDCSTGFSTIGIKHNSSTKAQATFSEKDILDQEVMESVSALLADEENNQIDDTKEDEHMSQNEESAAIIIPTKISSIVPDQKSVSVLNIYIARIYPTIYKHKSTDGKTVMLSQKQYGKIQRKQESENIIKQKKLLAEVEIEVKEQMLNKRKGRKPYSGPLKKEILDNMSPDDLLDIMEECNDVVSLERMISFEALKELKVAKSQREDAIRDAIHNEFESRRKTVLSEDPTALVKILALDMNSDGEGITLPKNCALISIWRPSEDMMLSLREGLAFYVTNLTPVPFPKPIIQLNTTIKTRFEPNDNPTESYHSIMRQSYNIKDVVSPNFSPCFGEFDVTGLVVSVRPVVRNTGQVIYISDECKTFLGIRFWNNIVEEGLDDVLQEGNFISISNLQWRMSSPKSRIPQAFAHENCLFRTNPKENSLSTSLDNLKRQIKDPKAFASTAEMTLFSILDGRNLTGNSSFNISFGQDSTTTGTTPMACSTPIGNNQYVNSTHTPNITPISNNASKRLQLLESYGDPPPLAALPTVYTPNVNTKFVAPFKK